MIFSTISTNITNIFAHQPVPYILDQFSSEETPTEIVRKIICKVGNSCKILAVVNDSSTMSNEFCSNLCVQCPWVLSIDMMVRQFYEITLLNN